MKEEKRKKIRIVRTVIMSILLLGTILAFVFGAQNEELKKNNVKILFKDTNIVGSNLDPGQCVFKVNDDVYMLEIDTRHRLKYVDLRSIKSDRLQYQPQKKHWYRIYGIHGDDTKDLIHIEWKKIEKGSASCAEKIVRIKRIKIANKNS